MSYIEFQPGEKYAKPGADTSEDINAFKDCGYLLTTDDVIIDIDCLNKDTIKKMITYFNIKTQIVWTKRGCHLYYKKPEQFSRVANRICCLGFPIEVKHSSNTKYGITIRQNGITRDIENEGSREILPEIFNKHKKFEPLLGVEDGDERNTKLFIHRKKLAGMQGWEKCLRFINNFIFAEPLEEKEFMSICRDLPIDTSELDENAVRSMMINELSIVKYGKDLWFYNDGEYIDDIDILRRAIFNKVPSAKTKFIDEVIKQIDYTAKKIDTNNPFDIKLNNGILRQGRFIQVDSKDFTPYTIHIDYSKDTKPVKVVDNYINKLTDGDEDYKNLLLEVLAHCFITDKEFKRLLAKFFIFRGDGSNGKGTLLQVIREILGSQNCASISITQMSDPARLYSLKGKLANLGDDIEGKPINYEQMKMLKNISTCDAISMRQLYKTEETLEITASLIFTSNTDIKSFEKGEAYQRRVMWMPIFTKIKEEEKEADFISKLTTPASLEYWIRLIVEAYYRLYNNKKFTVSEKVNEYNAKYHIENNAVEMFLKDIGIEDLLGKTISEIRDMMEEWNDDGDKLPSNKLIRQTIWNEFQAGFLLKKINNKVARVLTYQKDTNKDVKP